MLVAKEIAVIWLPFLTGGLQPLLHYLVRPFLEERFQGPLCGEWTDAPFRVYTWRGKDLVKSMHLDLDHRLESQAHMFRPSVDSVRLLHGLPKLVQEQPHGMKIGHAERGTRGMRSAQCVDPLVPNIKYGRAHGHDRGLERYAALGPRGAAPGDEGVARLVKRPDLHLAGERLEIFVHPQQRRVLEPQLVQEPRRQRRREFEQRPHAGCELAAGQVARSAVRSREEGDAVAVFEQRPVPRVAAGHCEGQFHNEPSDAVADEEQGPVTGIGTRLVLDQLEKAFGQTLEPLRLHDPSVVVAQDPRKIDLLLD